MTTVVHEDADVLGLSSLSGAHLEYAEDIVALLHENGREDVLFLVGGTIPGQDAARLKESGIAEVFGPGTRTGDIARFITDHFGRAPAKPLNEEGEG